MVEYTPPGAVSLFLMIWRDPNLSLYCYYSALHCMNAQYVYVLVWMLIYPLAFLVLSGQQLPCRLHQHTNYKFLASCRPALAAVRTSCMSVSVELSAHSAQSKHTVLPNEAGRPVTKTSWHTGNTHTSHVPNLQSFILPDSFWFALVSQCF